MEECQECGGVINEDDECNQCGASVEMTLFVTVVKVISEKVKLFKTTMEERLQIIKEDIISSITEETMRYQKILDSSITTLHNYMDHLNEIDLSEGGTNKIINPEQILNSLEIKNINFNVNAKEIHQAFLQVMKGEPILFREVFRKNQEVNL